jgi:hypothetical protein
MKGFKKHYWKTHEYDSMRFEQWHTRRSNFHPWQARSKLVLPYHCDLIFCSYISCEWQLTMKGIDMEVLFGCNS